MSEQTLRIREKLAKAVAKQHGVKVCSRCHVGIMREGGLCDYCKDHGHNKMKENEFSQFFKHCEGKSDKDLTRLINKEL